MESHKINSNNKIAIGIQARIGSQRLPGKILKKINNTQILNLIISRLKRVKHSEIFILTSKKRENLKLKKIAEKNSIRFIAFSKNENDVMSRFVKMIKINNPIAFIRVCSDNPFVDHRLINNLIDHYNKTNCDYVCNHVPLKNYNIVDGLGAELVKSSIFLNIVKTKNKFHREHVTSYIHVNKKKYKFDYCKFSKEIFFPNIKLDINTWDDLKKIKKFCLNEKILVNDSSSIIVKKYISHLFVSFLKIFKKKKIIKKTDILNFFQLNLKNNQNNIFFDGKGKICNFSAGKILSLKEVFEYLFIIQLVKALPSRRKSYLFDVSFKIRINKNFKRFTKFSKKIKEIRKKIFFNEQS